MPNGTGQKYRHTATRTRSGLPVFTGQINLDRESLDLPRSWRVPRVIFVNSMSDLFHEDVPLFYIKEIFGVIMSCPQHTFQILTKRPERAAELSGELPWPQNVWMGTSVEDDRVIDRVDELRRVPAQIRFLSCEPLIGPLKGLSLRGIHWVIVGGESGPGARPMDERWVLQIKRLCDKHEVPFFFKQWGGVQKHKMGRLLNDRTWDDMPALPWEEKCAKLVDEYRWKLRSWFKLVEALPVRSDKSAIPKYWIAFMSRYGPAFDLFNRAACNMIRVQRQNFLNQPGTLFAGVEPQPEAAQPQTVDRAVKRIAQPLQTCHWNELRWHTCGNRNVGEFTDSEVDQSIKRMLKNGWLSGASGEKVEEDAVLSPTAQLKSWIDR
jgi:protein gp37